MVLGRILPPSEPGRKRQYQKRKRPKSKRVHVLEETDIAEFTEDDISWLSDESHTLYNGWAIFKANFLLHFATITEEMKKKMDFHFRTLEKYFAKVFIAQSRLFKEISRMDLEEYKLATRLDDLELSIMRIDSQLLMIQTCYPQVALDNLKSLRERKLREVDYLESLLATMRAENMVKEELLNQALQQIIDDMISFFDVTNEAMDISEESRNGEHFYGEQPQVTPLQDICTPIAQHECLLSKLPSEDPFQFPGESNLLAEQIILITNPPVDQYQARLFTKCWNWTFKLLLNCWLLTWIMDRNTYAWTPPDATKDFRPIWFTYQLQHLPTIHFFHSFSRKPVRFDFVQSEIWWWLTLMASINLNHWTLLSNWLLLSLHLFSTLSTTSFNLDSF